jgi:meiotic recombination protein REC8
MDLDLDLDIPRFDEDDLMLPPPEPFPPMAPMAPAQPGFLRSSSEAPQEESSQSAEAPARRRPRAPRVLGMDEQKSLRNADLASWNNDYAANMADASRVKLQHKLPTLAKKNATFWVYGTGINGINTALGASNLASPLDMFAGDNLMAALIGVTPETIRRKRSHTEDEEQGSDSEARRVRMRDADGDQVGRGDDLILADDDTMGILDDDVSHQTLLSSNPLSATPDPHRRTSKSAATLPPPSKTTPPKCPGT